MILLHRMDIIIQISPCRMKKAIVTLKKLELKNRRREQATPTGHSFWQNAKNTRFKNSNIMNVGGNQTNNYYYGSGEFGMVLKMNNRI